MTDMRISPVSTQHIAQVQSSQAAQHAAQKKPASQNIEDKVELSAAARAHLTSQEAAKTKKTS